MWTRSPSSTTGSRSCSIRTASWPAWTSPPDTAGRPPSGGKSNPLQPDYRTARLARAATAMHTRPTPSPSRIRVVVADDSTFMRHIIADGLRERGAGVVAVAADGDEALRECARHSPDVLSLDLAMPGLDGIGVLKELRACGLDFAVVVVSPFSPAHGARAVDALAEGAVELVAKPSGGVLPDVFFAELYDKTHMAAASHRKTAAPPRPAPAAAAPPAPRPAPVRTAAARAMVIACS